jgi:hypothetical protein
LAARKQVPAAAQEQAQEQGTKNSGKFVFFTRTGKNMGQTGQTGQTMFFSLCQLVYSSKKWSVPIFRPFFVPVERVFGGRANVIRPA